MTTPKDGGPAVRQFLADAQWAIPSAESLKNGGCLELQALRASWLSALSEIGETEAYARAKGSGLCFRAPATEREDK